MSVRMIHRLAGLLICLGTFFTVLPAMAKQCQPLTILPVTDDTDRNDPNLHRTGERAGAPSSQTAASGKSAVAELRARKDVAAAMATIMELESDWAIKRLIELAEIPAPPFEEKERGLAFARMLREIGGLDVHIDQVGNVIARRKGTGTGSAVMLAAHLDTVFAKDVDVTVKRDGDRFTAPGIGDNSRGLVSLLMVARALEQHGIATERDILLVGTVGEEGTGDLRGMRHIFARPDHGIGSVVAIDGGEMDRLVDTAVGSNRYRVSFPAPVATAMVPLAPSIPITLRRGP